MCLVHFDGGGCSVSLTESGISFFFFFFFCLVLDSRLFSRMKRGRDDDAGVEGVERKKEEASQRLLNACKKWRGGVEAAKQAIDDGADVDVRTEYELFPLEYSADPDFGNSEEIVQMLIDAGCDVCQSG